MDKRTLELAAKAAGYELEWLLCDEGQVAILHPDCERWNPLQHDGDAWRLAEAIGARVDFYDGEVWVGDYLRVAYSEHAKDHNNSIQEALVALAARIGEAMP